MAIAVQFAHYGAPAVLEVIEVSEPMPGPGELRLAVRAAGVNPLDRKQRSGAVRDVMPVDLPTCPGVDVAGVVDAVGTDVVRFQIGDHVLGRSSHGSYTTVAIATESAVAHKPPTMAWDIAASLPVAVTTAAHALAVLRVTRGELLVIDGASGAVGTFAVQLAIQRGVTVIGTGSPHSHGRLRSFGAIPIPHGPGLLQRILDAADRTRPSAALDTAGMGGLADLVTAVGSPERVVTLADPDAFAIGATFLGANQGAEDTHEQPTLSTQVNQVPTGQLVAPTVTTYPMRDAASAHADGEAHRLKGKAILLP